MLRAISRKQLDKLVTLAEIHERATLEAFHGKFAGRIANLNDPGDLNAVEKMGKSASWYDLLEGVAMLKRAAQVEVHALLCLGIGWEDQWNNAMARAQSESNQLSTMELAGFTSFAQRLKAGLVKLDELATAGA